jgi:hypothetical protein
MNSSANLEGNKMVVIRFKSSEDEVNGYYLLAQKGVVRGLRRGFFEINDFMLKYLDEEGIKYEVVDENILNETEKIRNTPAIVL